MAAKAVGSGRREDDVVIAAAAAPLATAKEEEEGACKPMICVRKAPTGVVWVIEALSLLLPLPLSRCVAAALLDDDDAARCAAGSPAEPPLPEVAVAEALFDDTLDMCPPPLELNDRFLPTEGAGSEYSSATEDCCCITPDAF